MNKLPSLKLVRLAKTFSKASNALAAADNAFLKQLQKEFPESRSGDDGIAEFLTRCNFGASEQTPEKLMEIICLFKPS